MAQNFYNRQFKITNKYKDFFNNQTNNKKNIFIKTTNKKTCTNYKAYKNNNCKTKTGSN